MNIVRPDFVRWRFASDTDPEECQYKTQTLSKIDAFWSAFVRDSAGLLQERDPRKTAQWMEKHLHAIEKSLMWEITPREHPDNSILTITPESRNELRALTETIMSRAPRLQHWTLQTYREALSAEVVPIGFEARTNRRLPAFRAQCAGTESNGVTVTLSSPAFKKNDREGDMHDALLICELVLGEENTDKWIEEIRTTAGGVFQTTTEIDVKQLNDEFNRQKTDLLAQLPNKPYFASAVPEWSALYRLGDPAAYPPRLTIATWLKPFVPLIASQAFYSERLSAHGERFAYFQAIHVENYIEPDNREKLERQIDELLRSNNAGCVVGGGFGPPATVFIDLVLKDVDAAVPILTSICSENKIQEGAWLRFYDADWRNEWISVTEDPNGPVSPAELWA